MGLGDLFKSKMNSGKTNTTNTTNTTTQTSSAKQSRPLTYDEIMRELTSAYGEYSFYSRQNMPIPKEITEEIQKLKEYYAKIEEYLDDPEIPMDKKMLLITGYGQALIRFTDLVLKIEVFTHPAGEDGKVAKSLSLFNKAMDFLDLDKSDIYALRASMYDYFNYMYNMGMSAMFYASQIAALGVYHLPELLTQYVMLTQKAILSYIKEVNQEHERIEQDHAFIMRETENLNANYSMLYQKYEELNNRLDHVKEVIAKKNAVISQQQDTIISLENTVKSLNQLLKENEELLAERTKLLEEKMEQIKLLQEQINHCYQQEHLDKSNISDAYVLPGM